MDPNNKTAVMPFLTVRDGKKAIDFYVAAMGATVISKFGIADEKLSAKLAIDEALFCVADEEPQFGNLSPDEKNVSPVRIVLETREADEIFERALKLGATQICGMTTEEHWRIGKLKDPFGHIWEIGYQLIR